MAALNWYVGRNKSDPQYVRAPFYFDAILKWRGDLSADNEDLLGTVITIATTPRYGGEKVAEPRFVERRGSGFLVQRPGAAAALHRMPSSRDCDGLGVGAAMPAGSALVGTKEAVDG